MRSTYIYINKVAGAWPQLLVGALTALLPLLSACSETDNEDNEFADWKSRNESYFSGIYATAGQSHGTSTAWKVLKKWSMTDEIAAAEATNNVVVQVVSEGTGSGCPFYTDSVQVHYQLRLMPSSLHTDGLLVGSSYSGTFNAATAMPKSFPVASGMILDGLCTALQQMHIGDRWRVYVPYQQGFGSSDFEAAGSAWLSADVPAYSTLVCDMQLVAYYRAGESIPAWKAKDTGFWVEQ